MACSQLKQMKCMAVCGLKKYVIHGVAFYVTSHRIIAPFFGFDVLFIFENLLAPLFSDVLLYDTFVLFFLYLKDRAAIKISSSGEREKCYKVI